MIKGMRAFTLLELLIVVIILGVLASIAMPQYQRVVARAEAAEALTTLKVIVEAEQAYFALHGNYRGCNVGTPGNWRDLGIDMPNEDNGDPLPNCNFHYWARTEDNVAVAQRVGGTFNNNRIAMRFENFEIVPDTLTGDHPLHPY